MTRSLRVGLTQWHPTLDVEDNSCLAVAAIERCARDDAQLILLPENGLCLGTNEQMRERALTLDAPAIERLLAAARAANSTVVMGGFKHRGKDGVVRNSAAVIDRDGRIAGIYDKIHLFNARVQGQTFDASSVETAGDRPLLANVAGIAVGVTICFDVRFPELYRTLAHAGAEVLLVPSAFTRATGSAHWETLLRARAIENAAYVVASATISPADDPMATYGHALAVSPWGEVLADFEDAVFDARVLELDLGQREQMLQRLPVLAAARPSASATSPACIDVGQPSTARYGSSS